MSNKRSILEDTVNGLVEVLKIAGTAFIPYIGDKWIHEKCNEAREIASNNPIEKIGLTFCEIVVYPTKYYVLYTWGESIYNKLT